MKNDYRHKHTVWISDALWDRISRRYPLESGRPSHTAINSLLAAGYALIHGDDDFVEMLAKSLVKGGEHAC